MTYFQNWKTFPSSGQYLPFNGTGIVFLSHWEHTQYLGGKIFLLVKKCIFLIFKVIEGSKKFQTLQYNILPHVDHFSFLNGFNMRKMTKLEFLTAWVATLRAFISKTVILFPECQVVFRRWLVFRRTRIPSFRAVGWTWNEK